MNATGFPENASHGEQGAHDFLVTDQAVTGASAARIASARKTACQEEVNMQQDTSDKIRGVWNIESMDVGIGPNSSTKVPKAFMFFITKSHYTAIRDFSAPSGSESADDPPPADRMFMADAGTYEFDGTNLTVHHMVAKFPVLGSMTFGCSIEDDDTLILEPQYDKMVLPGLDLKPTKDGKMAYGDVATRYVFKRLE